MIKLENISKSYVKGKKSVDSLNLEIKDGEIFGFWYNYFKYNSFFNSA